MVVQHNLTAMNANRYYGMNNNKLSKSLEKLSSGYAINKAGDNAAGLAVSEKMRAQISGLTQASKNSEDGISMVQTFEGALTETDSILQRMRSLAEQSANGSYDDSVDRAAIQLEYDQLNNEMDQIADTDYNGVVVLNGGTMADGTKADANGLIDYATATREAQQLGTAGGFVKGIGARDYVADKEETVTFTAAVDSSTGNVTWKASDGAKNAASTEANGGFSYDGAVFSIDTTKVVNGDTITANFSKAKAASGKAAQVTGYNVDNGTFNGTTTTGAKLTLDTTNNVDSAIAGSGSGLANAINALNNLTISESVVGTSGASTLSKLNNVDITGAADEAHAVVISKLSDTESLKADSTGQIYYVSGSTSTKIAKVDKGTYAGVSTTKDGTVTTSALVSQASYTPATSSGVELVEPDSKVSQSNSNDASTAKLTYTDNITLQVGARTKDSVNFTFSYKSDGLGSLKDDLNCTSKGLGTKDLDLSTQKGANAAIDKIDNAINKVSMVRGTFGSIQNRLEHKIDNLNTTNENLTAAESRIRDTDMATEMMNFTKNQILTQASQSMLAQANQLPQGVLQLLQ